MDVVYVYQKKRSQFGRRPDFSTTEITELCDCEPQPQLSKDHIEISPLHKGIQWVPELSIHGVNTVVSETKESGMLHLEGGWELNMNDLDAKKRFCKKIENSEPYQKTLSNLADQVCSFLKQNIALNIYEDYFEDMQQSRALIFTEPPRAKVITVFKDPVTRVKRIASKMSWIPTDGSKLAVAYCRLQQGTVGTDEMLSCIWDIRNSNSPDLTLSPSSPLYCIEYNPKDSTYLVAGSLNGTLSFFDTRRGSQPVDYSRLDSSHRDIVQDVKWIQSKNSTACLSVSTDGLIYVWDVRNLQKPVGDYIFENTDPKKGYVGSFGGLCIDYDIQYSPTKFLFGTEQGYCVSWNRKTRSKNLVDRIYFGHHGPVYAIQRNPIMPKYFLSVGDWTARIWVEDMTTTAIMTTKYHESYFTSGCWSTSRPGVFFTTKMDGNLDIWDLLHNHKQPVLSVNLTDSGLYSIRNHNGKYLACGGYDGTVSYVELSGDLSNFVGDEKKAFSEERKAIDEMFERESKREKSLDALQKELARKKRDQSKTADKKQTSQTTNVDQELDKLTEEYFQSLENPPKDD